MVAYIPIDFENNSNIKKILEMNAKGNPMDETATNPNGIDNFGQPGDQIDDGSGGFGGGDGSAM